MIGDVEPVGICGSGLVDAVAELVARRDDRPLGPLRRRAVGFADRLGEVGEEHVFHLADDVYLSQRDVRELQFAKASIATGWKILCRELGVAPRGRSPRCCSPARFGSYLSPASAVRIGLVPSCPLTRIVSAGNMAGEGAKIAALSVQERAAASAIVDEVRVRRALRPRRLQRPVHRPARLPRMTTRPSSSPAERSRSTSRDRARGAAGTLEVRAAAARAAQPARADRAAVEELGCRRRRRRARLRRLRHARRARRARPARLAGRRLLRRSRARGARVAGRRARHVLPDRLPRPQLRPGRPGAGSASTGTPSCATTTSATTRGSLWLAQRPTPALSAAAEHAAARSAFRSRSARSATPGSERQLERAGRVIVNSLPRYEILSEEAMEALDRGWRRIVTELGIEFILPEAVEEFRKAGQKVEGAVRQARPGVPARAGGEGAARSSTSRPATPSTPSASAATTWSSRPSTAARSSAKGDERREATMDDFENLVRLSQAFPQLDSPGGTICEPNDRPLDSRHLDMVFALQTLSDKPYMGSVTSGPNARGHDPDEPRSSSAAASRSSRRRRRSR